MTLDDLGSWLQDGVTYIALAWSRTFAHLTHGQLGQIRVGDLVVIGLTCMVLGWFIDRVLRDPEPVRKERRANR